MKQRPLSVAEVAAVAAYVAAVREYIRLEKGDDAEARKAQAERMFAAYRAVDTQPARVAAYDQLNAGWRAP